MDQNPFRMSAVGLKAPGNGVGGGVDSIWSRLWGAGDRNSVSHGPVSRPHATREAWSSDYANHYIRKIVNLTVGVTEPSDEDDARFLANPSDSGSRARWGWLRPPRAGRSGISGIKTVVLYAVACVSPVPAHGCDRIPWTLLRRITGAAPKTVGDDFRERLRPSVSGMSCPRWDPSPESQRAG
jgi:hypothetical protein